MNSSFQHINRRDDDYDDDDDDEDDDEQRQEDEDDDDDVGTEDGTTAESSPGPYDLELHSMTAKGIKHLCSELLEINEASQEDFQRNVHLTYLSFLRLFQEAGELERDVGHLKRHAMAQRSLVQRLADNLYSSIAAASPENCNSKEEEIDCSPNLAADVVVVDQLDVLLSEHRMDQAMELLEKEGQALEKMQNDDGSACTARVIASAMSALSARKARVADRFAALADNPRTPRHELLRALAGLCSLGDAQRANHLLFKFHRSGGRRVDDQPSCRSSSSSSQRNYIKELACAVFSSIHDASRSFLALHGQPSPELRRWAKEEVEDLGVAFHEYVSSVPEAGEGLTMAIEAASCAASCCASMLRPLGIFLEEYLVASIRPCMEELLAMRAKHLKQVVRLFVSSDRWVLGRFLMSGIRRTSPAAGAAAVEIEHCLLTTSGRKFVTLIQEVVEEVSPLLYLGMKSSVLQLLAGLFREYMHSIVDIIPKKEEGTHANQQQYMWQLSVLINCTTLVALFPIIAHGVFKSKDVANQAQPELDGLVLFIKEAAGRVWAQFCRQFIRDTMSNLQKKPRTSSWEGIFTSSQQGGMMPSFAFQVLFLRVRQLSNLYGTILTGKDETMKKLLQELMEAMIIWLHDNLDSWIHQARNVPNDKLFHQIQLDVHFLLELAQVGGFSSDNIRTSAMDLLRKAEEKVSSLEQSMNSSVIHDEAWASDAAKRAIQLLIGAEVNSSSSQEEASVQTEEDVLNAGGSDMTRNSQEGEETDNQIDDSAAGSGQNDMLDTWSNEHAGSLALDETGCDGKSTDDFISIEDDGGAAESNTEDDMSSESPLESTQVLDSENEGDNIISDHKVSGDIPVDVHGPDQCRGGEAVEANEAHGVQRLAGSGSSEICHAAMEATPCNPQDDDEDDSSCSFTTPPELLQDNKRSSIPVPVVTDSADEGTAAVVAPHLHDEMGMPDENVEDAMSMSSTEGSDQHSDPGSGRRRRGGGPAAAENAGGSGRKKREAMSRSSRPRWQ